jgi:hypothetical protein
MCGLDCDSAACVLHWNPCHDGSLQHSTLQRNCKSTELCTHADHNYHLTRKHKTVSCTALCASCVCADGLASPGQVLAEPPDAWHCDRAAAAAAAPAI